MAISSDEIIRWLNSLAVGTIVGIDEGGLMLQVVGDSDTYFEIGGIPDGEELPEDEDAMIYCPGCKKEVRDDSLTRTSIVDHGRCFDCQREWLDTGDKEYSRFNWEKEVSKGDTTLGYAEWVEHKHAIGDGD